MVVLSGVVTVDDGMMHEVPESVPDEHEYVTPAVDIVDVYCPRHIMAPLYENGEPNGHEYVLFAATVCEGYV